MMKKFLWLMAVCLTFAMTGCGKDDGGGETPKVTVAYDIGSSDSEAPTAPASVTINKGGSLGEDQLASPVDPDELDWESSEGLIYTFLGWFDAIEDGNEITTATPFNANATIYAQWDVTVPTGKALVKFNLNYSPPTGSRILDEVVVTTSSAVGAADWPADPVRDGGYTFGGWFRGVTKYVADTIITADGVVFNLTAKWLPGFVTITFDYNYTGAPAPLVIQAYKGSPIETRYWPAVGGRGGYAFDGWYDAAEGGTAVLATKSFNASATLYAQWGDQTFGSGDDFDGAERVFLENGSYAVYKFTLTSQWQQYEKLTIDFALDEANFGYATDYYTANFRGARVLGMYQAGSYAFTEKVDADPDATPPVTAVDGGTERDANGLLVMRLNNDTLFNYILDNTTAFPDAITGANQWCTVTYDITGFKAHDNWNLIELGKGKGQAEPAPEYTGDLYVAVGLTRGTAPYNPGGFKRPLPRDGLTQWIRNVTLVPYGNSSAAEVVAVKPPADIPQFVTNIDPVVFSWRGNPTDPVVIPPDPVPIYTVTPDAAYRELSYPASAADVSLPLEFTWDFNGDRKGWKGSGTDSETTDLEIRSIVWAKSLVLTFAEGKVPAGECTLFWQTNVATGWNTVVISANSGYGTDDPPAGVTYDAETGTVTIEFAQLMNVNQLFGWNTATTAHKFGIQYYGPKNANWDNIELTGARLIMDQPER
jgi:hypothetical protein